MTSQKYKDLSVKEFTKAAEIYESNYAGVYKMCKKDYPDVSAELEKEPFNDLPDCTWNPLKSETSAVCIVLQENRKTLSISMTTSQIPIAVKKYL